MSDAVVADLQDDTPVALGFECPLFVPVPTDPFQLGKARQGEGRRAWSAGAGAMTFATGLAQAAWILRELQLQCPGAEAHLDWKAFCSAGRGLFVWEAFVTGTAKKQAHVEDAGLAVESFWQALPDLVQHNMVTTPTPLSTVGAALLWAGWSSDLDLLSSPVVVLRAG